MFSTSTSPQEPQLFKDIVEEDPAYRAALGVVERIQCHSGEKGLNSYDDNMSRVPDLASNGLR